MVMRHYFNVIAIKKLLHESSVEMLLSSVCSNRLRDAAMGQLDGLHQTMRRGDAGALRVEEEKS